MVSLQKLGVRYLTFWVSPFEHALLWSSSWQNKVSMQQLGLVFWMGRVAIGFSILHLISYFLFLFFIIFYVLYLAVVFRNTR